MGRIDALLGTVRSLLRRFWDLLADDPEDRQWERAAVRLIVPLAFVVAGVTAALVAYQTDQSPAVAFENHLIFAGELFLLTFYGVLLILVPLVRAMASGELPIELTARGARFSERAGEGALAANEQFVRWIKKIEDSLTELERREVERDRGSVENLITIERDLSDLRRHLDEVARKLP
jgi:hypothetical protein